MREALGSILLSPHLGGYPYIIKTQYDEKNSPNLTQTTNLNIT